MPLLESIAASSNPTGELVRKVERRTVQLRATLSAAPFVAASTVSLPGTLAVEPDSPSQTAPSADPRRPDRYEPDDTRARATVLPLGTSQEHTLLHGDTDWIALPNDAGPGVYYFVASGPFRVEEKVFASDAEMHREDRVGGVFALVRPTFAGRVGGLGRYSWLKITALESPITYRISQLKRAPSAALGEEVPGVTMMNFSDAVGSLDAGGYFDETGRLATTAQLAALRDALFGRGAQDGGGANYGIDSGENDPVQRTYESLDGTKPSAFWIRTQKRETGWVVTAAGLDGSWTAPPHAATLREYLTLSQWAMNNVRYDEPVIYLYPAREQTVTVGLGYRGVVTTTAPAIDPATHSWTVRARPDGRLTDVAGVRWPYLFWEGRGAQGWDLSTGAVVRREDADEFLRSALGRLGLSAGESAAFREYWVARLQAAPYALIHFEGVRYERLAPLRVSPRPDVELRVFMVARPLEAPVTVRPQFLATPPARHGFTLVEWGGALLPE